MASIVQEIMRDAADSKSDLEELLRKALIVATQLDLEEFRQWITYELEGYPPGHDSLPKYRTIYCSVEAHNPYQGWRNLPFNDRNAAKNAMEVPTSHPIASLIQMASRLKDKDGKLEIPIPPGIPQDLGNGWQMHRFADSSQLSNLLGGVRTALLNWTLRLDKNGISGNGATFTRDEVQRATTVFNIQSVHGVAGTVSGQNIQIGDYATLVGSIEQADLASSEKEKFKSLMREIQAAPPETKQSVAKRATEWTTRNWDKLAGLGVQILSAITKLAS